MLLREHPQLVSAPGLWKSRKTQKPELLLQLSEERSHLGRAAGIWRLGRHRFVLRLSSLGRARSCRFVVLGWYKNTRKESNRDGKKSCCPRELQEGSGCDRHHSRGWESSRSEGIWGS